MDKIFILKICVFINFVFLFLFLITCIVFNNNESTYFSIGWSSNFTFISITIDTPLKYFSLCAFIITMNASDVFLNDAAGPLITFSTYNPYRIDINDFTRFELEFYSNIISFIKLAKGLLFIATTVSHFDLALLSLISSQVSVFLVVKYLLDNKNFHSKNVYVEVPNYHTINEETDLIKKINI